MSLRDFRNAGHTPTLAAAFLYFDVSFMVWVLLGPLAPFLTHDLKLTATQTGLLTAIPLLGGSLFRIVLGIMTEQFGARRTGLTGLGVTLLPLAAGWKLASTYGEFLALGLLLGVAGASFAAALPLASGWYPPEHQGLAMGIAGAGNSGTLMATLFSPRLARAFGWHMVFGLALIPVAIVWLAFFAMAKDSPGSRTVKKWTDYAAVLREPDAWWFCFVYSITFGGFVGLASYLSTFFHSQYKLTPVAAGDFTTVVVVCGSFLRPVGGLLADRFGGYRMLLGLLTGVGMCLAGVATLPSAGAALALLAVAMGMLGMGNGSVFQLVPQRFRGRVGVMTGIVGAAGGFGGFLLPSLLGTIKDRSGSFAPGFALFAAGALVGAAALSSTGRVWRVRWTPECARLAGLIPSIAVLIAIGARVAGAQTAAPAPASAPAQGFVPSEELNRALPSWLAFSGEYRVRLEDYGAVGFKFNNSDTDLVSRLRLSLRIVPASWLRFLVQAQDSRIFFNQVVASAPPNQNSMDLRLAYVDIGKPEGPFLLRAGRQELDFGDQRLVGTADWLNVPRNFDAVRAAVHKGGYRLDAFASSIVVATDGAFDHHTEGNNLYGLYGGLERLVPGAVIEPYVFWRVSPRQKQEDGKLGSLDAKTGGVRFAGKVPQGFDYGLEMDLQRGNIGIDPVSAWAGHWVLGYTVPKARYQPRIFAEYNYASGDRNPNDNHIGTFDQLYPSAHDKYGMDDQIGWRNIRDARAGVSMKPARPVTASLVGHDWWLASGTDALYNAAGAAVARVASGADGTHVGEELDLQGSWAINGQLKLGGGVGHIFPGGFLRRATQGSSYTYPYVMLGIAF